MENNIDVKKVMNLLGHEIRNVLANFTNASYLLRSEAKKMAVLDEKCKAEKYIDIIDRGVISMNGIVQDIIDYSSVRQPSFLKADLSEICREASDEFKLLYNMKIDIEDCKGLLVSADSNELKRVLKHILKNSVQSIETPENGLIKIKLYMDNENNSAVVEISDNGSGMEAAVVEKATEPFFTTKNKGLGLGLTIVKKIIEERHGGKFAISGVPGKGTVAVVRVPTIGEKIL